MNMQDLKKLRIEKGLTQLEIAKHCGVSPTAYRMWEFGVATPKPENMEKLKEVLNLK